MAQDFGVSFVPSEQNMAQRPGGSRAAVSPTQQAIRLLSLRLPKVLGGSPIAPAPLLQSQGGAGMPSPTSVAQQVLKRVLPTDQTAQASGAVPSAAPSPEQAAAPSAQIPSQTSAMQAPSAGYSPNPRTMEASPFKAETPFSYIAQQAGAGQSLPGIGYQNVPGAPPGTIDNYGTETPPPNVTPGIDVGETPGQRPPTIPESEPPRVPDVSVPATPMPPQETADPTFAAILQDILNSRRTGKNAPPGEML